jgi:hypothetical protein
MLRPLLIAVASGLVAAAALPSGAAAFGTVNILHQRAEHERITRLALGCRAGQPHDGSCFESHALTNVAGTDHEFGAVGGPDNIPLHESGGPAKWHCDDADYQPRASYPRTREQATDALRNCREWARALLFDGPKLPTYVNGKVRKYTFPNWGAVEQAKDLLSGGRVDVNDPGTGIFSPDCSFNGRVGRVKCMVWEAWGYVLHTAEDFYSHSNWADEARPGGTGVDNPLGLAHRDLASMWNLGSSGWALPDEDLATGCYPTSACAGRITHDEGLNKDKEEINRTTGVVTDPITPRGKVGDNAQRAVDGAIAEARRQWEIFRRALVDRYGFEAGGKMICALTSDSADASCNDAAKAGEAAQIPPARLQITSAANPTKCIDDPQGSRSDLTQIQLFDCNGTQAQVFQFTGRDLQYTGTGTSDAVRVMGKCLDAPEGSTEDGTRIQLFGCNGSSPQSITLTADRHLRLLGKCLALQGGSTNNGTAIVLAPCADREDEIWVPR